MKTPPFLQISVYLLVYYIVRFFLNLTVFSKLFQNFCNKLKICQNNMIYTSRSRQLFHAEQAIINSKGVFYGCLH